MNTTISGRAIGKLIRKLRYLRFDCGVQVSQITVEKTVPAIREILGNHDETGRLAAQVKQALIQGAV